MNITYIDRLQLQSKKNDFGLLNYLLSCNISTIQSIHFICLAFIVCHASFGDIGTLVIYCFIDIPIYKTYSQLFVVI